jgi:hypothetical protein
MSKAMMGKYDLIERQDMDDALKELCYKMIKMVKNIIYIHMFVYVFESIIYIYMCVCVNI